jgi:hypothetical protein
MASLGQVIAFAIALTGVTSNTATIASVDTTRSCIMWGGQISNQGGGDQRRALVRTVLTDATTVTATKGVSTGNSTVYGTVVEFDASVITSREQNSVTIASGATSGTATLSTTVADTTKAVLFFHGHECGDVGATANAVDSQCALDLTNSTTVTAVRNTGTADRSITASFTVIEFASSFIASVEKRSVTLTSANTSDTDTISSVDTARSFLVWNGFTTARNNAVDAYYRIALTNGTTVTLTRQGTVTTTRTYKYTVVQLQSGILDSVEQGSTAVASATSNTTTLSTSVDTSRSYLNYQGVNTSSNTSLQTEIYHGEVLTDGSTVTVNRNTAGTVTGNGGWAVLQFAAGGGGGITGPLVGFGHLGGGGPLVGGRLAA